MHLTGPLFHVAALFIRHHNKNSTLSMLACALLWIWGLSSVSVTQLGCPRPPVALTGLGLMQRDSLSHAAMDAPLAYRLSLYLSTDLWMQSDKRLRRRCPFLPMIPDVRVQEHHSSFGQFIPCVGITLLCDLLC